MSDELAERIKAMEQEHRERKRVKVELKTSGDRINEFISGHAREEYEKMNHLLKERAEEMNGHGIMPPFVVNGLAFSGATWNWTFSSISRNDWASRSSSRRGV